MTPQHPAAPEGERATGAIVPERQRCICGGVCMDHCRACNYSGRDLEEPCIADPDWEADDDDLARREQNLPAAPEGETDVRLTEAECQSLAEALGKRVSPHGFLAIAVERIVAERLRVVEGERDAAHEAGYWVGYREGKDEAETRDLNFDEATARAESAKAAHAALVAEVAKIHGGTHWCHDSEGQGVVFEPGTEWWPCPTGALLAGGGA